MVTIGTTVSVTRSTKMTDYTDLIKRQRNFIGGELGNATADAIESLQTRVKRLEDALRMVVEEYADGGDWQSVDRAARVALAEGDKR